MKHIKKINEFFSGIKAEFDDNEIGKPGSLKKKELVLKASKIIGKQLSSHEQDIPTAIKEISDFIELNITNKNMVKNIDELTDIKKMLKESKMEKQIKLSDFDGLEDAAKDFKPFKILDYKTDPGYGYDGVKLLFISFDNGELGLCIYDVNDKEFIEEPSVLEDYNITEIELYKKYGFKK